MTWGFSPAYRPQVYQPPPQPKLVQVSPGIVVNVGAAPVEPAKQSTAASAVSHSLWSAAAATDEEKKAIAAAKSEQLRRFALREMALNLAQLTPNVTAAQIYGSTDKQLGQFNVAVTNVLRAEAETRQTLKDLHDKLWFYFEDLVKRLEYNNIKTDKEAPITDYEAWISDAIKDWKAAADKDPRILSGENRKKALEWADKYIATWKPYWEKRKADYDESHSGWKTVGVIGAAVAAVAATVVTAGAAAGVIAPALAGSIGAGAAVVGAGSQLMKGDTAGALGAAGQLGSEMGISGSDVLSSAGGSLASVSSEIRSLSPSGPNISLPSIPGTDLNTLSGLAQTILPGSATPAPIAIQPVAAKQQAAVVQAPAAAAAPAPVKAGISPIVLAIVAAAFIFGGKSK